MSSGFPELSFLYRYARSYAYGKGVGVAMRTMPPVSSQIEIPCGRKWCEDSLPSNLRDLPATVSIYRLYCLPQQRPEPSLETCTPFRCWRIRDACMARERPAIRDGFDDRLGCCNEGDEVKGQSSLRYAEHISAGGSQSI